MSELEHVLRVEAKLGEGPLWDPAEGVLYFVASRERVPVRMIAFSWMSL